MPPLSDITEEHYKLIKKIASFSFYRYGGFFSEEKEDLIAAIRECLYRSYELYDPDKGMSLENYLWQRGRWAVIDVQRDNLKRLTGKNKNNFDREDPQTIIFNVEDAISFDQLLSRNGSSVIDDHSALDLKLWIKSLPTRQRFIYYALIAGYTQEQIGNFLGVTESRISQICTFTKTRYLRGRSRYYNSSPKVIPTEK